MCDEHAIIKVSGMAYQLPLLGYRQLLNFLASSFPDCCEYLIIGAGSIAFACLVSELFLCRKRNDIKKLERFTLCRHPSNYILGWHLLLFIICI